MTLAHLLFLILYIFFLKSQWEPSCFISSFDNQVFLFFFFYFFIGLFILFYFIFFSLIAHRLSLFQSQKIKSFI